VSRLAPPPGDGYMTGGGTAEKSNRGKRRRCSVVAAGIGWLTYRGLPEAGSWVGGMATEYGRSFGQRWVVPTAAAGSGRAGLVFSVWFTQALPVTRRSWASDARPGKVDRYSCTPGKTRLVVEWGTGGAYQCAIASVTALGWAARRGINGAYRENAGRSMVCRLSSSLLRRICTN
jgi:hypothetical protein